MSNEGKDYDNEVFQYEQDIRNDYLEQYPTVEDREVYTFEMYLISRCFTEGVPAKEARYFDKKSMTWVPPSTATQVK